MKHPAYSIIIMAAFMLSGIAFCKPPDTRAADVLGIVKIILAREKDRLLSQTELDSVVNASKVDNAAVRMAAAYALSFSDSDTGKKVLAVLRGDADAGVAGVAEFAVIRKHTSMLSQDERLAVMSFKLGCANTAWTRALIVTSLGEEFKGTVAPLFLSALEKEKDPLVRAEIFFQIAGHGNKDQLKMIESVLAKEKQETATAFNETTVFFLNAISRGRNDRKPLVSTSEFLKDVTDARTHNGAQTPSK